MAATGVRPGERGDTDVVMRSAARWAATHGVMRLAIRARAHAGNPDAEVLRDPAVREDPFAHYERLRTATPFADGALGTFLLTVV